MSESIAGDQSANPAKTESIVKEDTASATAYSAAKANLPLANCDSSQSSSSPSNSSQASSSSSSYSSMVPSYDYVFSLLIIGDPECGKTHLSYRYCGVEFTEADACTKEFSFKARTIRVNDKETKLKVWDGMKNYEQYPVQANPSFKGAHGIIVCFDVTNEDSFNHVRQWHEKIQKCASPDIPVMLVGNKVDLSAERVISSERAVALADKLGFAYKETSAKENKNVVQVFEQMAAQIIAKISPAATQVAQAETVKIEEVANHRDNFWGGIKDSAKETVKEWFSFSK